MKGLEFAITGGIKARLKGRCRSTRLAGFAEKYPGAIDAVNELVTTAQGPMKIDERMASLFLRGLSPLDTAGVIEFLAEQIAGFDLPEEFEDAEWQDVDWKALAPDGREETIDFLLSTLDLVSLFIAAWSHYQGMGVRARRG